MILQVDAGFAGAGAGTKRNTPMRNRDRQSKEHDSRDERNQPRKKICRDLSSLPEQLMVAT
jgi:hypothetical protein